MKVAALYIDPRGPYPKLLGPEMCWDEARDARTYAGPWPVVAHPPCGAWGKLRHLYEGSDRDCAPIAIEQVRRFGGVLEHPAGSELWRIYQLPPPDVLMSDGFGFSFEVDQCAWGHVARKRTWLYVAHVPRTTVTAGIRFGGTPTHWLSGGRTSSSRKGSPVPPGIKVCSAQQRRRTPTAFAEWLISLAAQAGKERAA